jgi:hypothetical protein
VQGSGGRNKPEGIGGEGPRTPAAAMGPSEAFATLTNDGFDHASLVWRFGKAGEVSGGERRSFRPESFERKTPMLPRQALAYDGRNFLLAVQCSQLLKGGEIRAHVYGCRIAPDGKPLDDLKTGFAIADEAGRDHILPAAAAGPEGVCLVVYSEARGIDDTKLLARIVK